jgi:hypothetical protein
MKDFASGGAILVVVVEATSLLTGSKEVVVVLKLSHSIFAYGDNTSKLKGIGP